jgi:hypothetical protein
VRGDEPPHRRPTRTLGATPPSAGTEPDHFATSTTSSPRVSPVPKIGGISADALAAGLSSICMTGRSPHVTEHHTRRPHAIDIDIVIPGRLVRATTVSGDNLRLAPTPRPVAARRRRETPLEIAGEGAEQSLDNRCGLVPAPAIRAVRVAMPHDQILQRHLVDPIVVFGLNPVGVGLPILMEQD